MLNVNITIRHEPFLSRGPFLSSNFFPIFPLFNRGQNIWKASHSNIGAKKKRKIWKNKKLSEKNPGNLDKKSFDKNGPGLKKVRVSQSRRIVSTAVACCIE